MNEHPSKDIVGTKGNELKGKRIVLCITGSVAAVRMPRNCQIPNASRRRSLHRNVADVTDDHPPLSSWNGQQETSS